jgi:hypothetical protein
MPLWGISLTTKYILPTMQEQWTSSHLNVAGREGNYNSTKGTKN